MCGSLILVRHAQPRVAADRVPGAWVLSEEGIDSARRLGLRLRNFSAGTPVAVVASTERKAIETADALGLGDVNTDERLCEVSRPWHDDEESFRAAIQRFFTGVPINGWELVDEAVARFGSVINGLGGTSVVVSHGTVVSAWLVHQIPSLDPVSFWAGLQMPDAWLVDLGAQTTTRIAIEVGP